MGLGHRIRSTFHDSVWQSLAVLFCVLFGIAMIVNNQLQGEAWWFWYAQLFHGGARLYADMHLALQPLMVLETDAWMQLFGTKCLVTETPSVIYVFVFSMGMFLILRESDWPDWQKAIVLAGAFLISVECGAYRFDDFHIIADIFIYYSLVLLLLLARADTAQRQFGLAAGLGILSGLTITTRLSDGGALLAAVGVCLLFLTRKRKLAVAGLFVIAAAVTALLIVKLTGDSLADYASNSIIRAAGAKGGTVRVLTGPHQLFLTAIHGLRGRKWLFLWTAAIVVVSALLQHYWKNKFRYLIALQLGIAGIAYALSSQAHREQLRTGTFFSFAALVLILMNYLLIPAVAAHFIISKTGDGAHEWDSREILVLLPLAELASFSMSNGTIVAFLSPIALLLLLVPVIRPFRSRTNWANATLVTVMALMVLSAMTEKIHSPYAWLHFRDRPMFENRQWYRHPVYGPMYIDRDLLHFIEPVCREIGEGNPKPELLSMPFSYANYFCNTPPWHGYVQTFFDTSTRSTIDQLMGELNTTPPQWIVYEREMDDLTQLEKLFNGSRPLPHRDLDSLIMRKIATGQWQATKSNYLFEHDRDGNGWLIIQTRPGPAETRPALTQAIPGGGR